MKETKREIQIFYIHNPMLVLLDEVVIMLLSMNGKPACASASMPSLEINV